MPASGSPPDICPPQDPPDLGHARIPRPSRSQVISIVATAGICIGLYYFLPASINELQRRMICIFVVASVFWAREVLPLFATSLLVIGMMILSLASKGGLAQVLPGIGEVPADSPITAKDFLATFGSNIIMLFMGGFLLSRALTKHGIDRAIAARVLQPFTSSPLRLLYGVLGISAFFSMWMSNTATAAMMLAIIGPILKQIPHEDAYHRGLILAVPFGANIGGIGTPIGTPPNAVAFAAINASGTPITFLQWMMIGLPLALLLLAGVGVLLLRTHPPGAALRLKKLEGPGRVSWYGKLTLGVLLSAVALWLTGQWHGIGAGTVALLAAAALTALSVLDRHDVDSIDWNILILMWGGLAMGTGMEVSGLTDLIAAADPSQLPGGGLMIAVVVVCLSILLSTFMSNTATANLLLPIIMALAIAGDDRIHLAVLCALACSFAMAMPVSTPPNAIAFATGEVRAGTLLKLGGGVSIFAGIVLLLGYRVVLPVVL
ncbi:MAG: DASS family sodium-coupled anion symporter [Planctomycetota bacterium]